MKRLKKDRAPFAGTSVKARLAVAAATLAMATCVGASSAAATEGSLFEEMGTADSRGGGVIASRHREASLAGLEILNKEGNAMDAAAATMFAAGVASFESCGIGGGGFLVYRTATGQAAALDFREWSPKEYKFTKGASIDPGGAVGLEGATDPIIEGFGTGHNVVGIPGGVAGMDEALNTFGTMSLAEVLAPATDLARDGFTVEHKTAAQLRDPVGALVLSAFPNSARQYLPAALAESRGEKYQLPELVEDYEELARYGARAFYDPELEHGTIADDLLAEMARPTPYQDDKAEWDATDLTEYEAKWRTPVRTTYRGSEVIGMPAPSSAGVAIAEMLNILEGFDLREAGQSSADRFHLVAEAQKLAWRDRNAYLADPDFAPTPPHLTSKSYAEQLRAEIDPERAQSFSSPTALAEGTNTHNLAVIDKWGNAAAINCSLNAPMGSQVVAHGTGFFLNNELTDFDDVAGHVNRPQPRKRPRSSMAPTIVVRRDRPVLVTGGIGGPGIIAATANITLNVLDFRQSVAQAVDAERGDARGCPGDGLQLCLEDARIAPAVIEDLKKRDHEVKPFPFLSDFDGFCTPPPGGSGCEYWSGMFNQAVGFQSRDGRNYAAADPRLVAGGNASTADGAVAQPDED